MPIAPISWRMNLSVRLARPADRAQGQLLLDAIGGFTTRTPELGGALVLQEFKVAAPRTGATLSVLSADAASVWGLRPYFSTIDELGVARTPRTQRVVEAVTTGSAKVLGSRIVTLSTAGDPAHFSRKMLDHSYAEDPWRVHEIPGSVPWMDRQRIEGERRRLPESAFRRLFLNEWASGEDRLPTGANPPAGVLKRPPRISRPVPASGT